MKSRELTTRELSLFVGRSYLITVHKDLAT